MSDTRASDPIALRTGVEVPQGVARATRLMVGSEGVASARRAAMRNVIYDAVTEFTNKYPEWSHYEPDNVKDLARFIRDALERNEVSQRLSEPPA